MQATQQWAEEEKASLHQRERQIADAEARAESLLQTAAADVEKQGRQLEEDRARLQKEQHKLEQVTQHATLQHNTLLCICARMKGCCPPVTYEHPAYEHAEGYRHVTLGPGASSRAHAGTQPFTTVKSTHLCAYTAVGWVALLTLVCLPVMSPCWCLRRSLSKLATQLIQSMRRICI